MTADWADEQAHDLRYAHPSCVADALRAARTRGIEEAAQFHERRAELHGRDAKWMGPDPQYLQGARIPGAAMSPMNGPAMSHDHEIAAAAAIRALVKADLPGGRP
jgi:hypothetical protein